MGIGQAALDRQVTCLLGNPGGIGMGGDAGQVHPTGRKLNEEENVKRFQPHGFHAEKITGYDTGGLPG